jgi:acid stress-induced BolA-like protein IbaG/YrbA
MALKILSAPSDPAATAEQLRDAVVRALAGAQVRVRATSPGHFEVEAVWPGFAGKSRVAQHQLVYQAIKPLLSGDAPPVHAIDRLDCRIA